METINYFYQKDESGNVILVDGSPVTMKQPQPCSLDKLKRMIASGKKAAAIESHTQLVADTMNYKVLTDHLDKVAAYDSELAKYNTDIEIYNTLSTEQKELVSEPVQPESIEPLSFEPTTVEMVTAWVSSEIEKQQTTTSKLSAFEFNDVVCSVTESDQNGWGALTVLIDNAIAAGVPFSPIPFKNENGNTVTIETREDWTTFILTAAQSRQAFFS